MRKILNEEEYFRHLRNSRHVSEDYSLSSWDENAKSVAKLNNHDRFGYLQPKTMFLCGMCKAEIKSLVQETVFAPKKYTIEEDGTHVAEKSFLYNVGEFVYYDNADNLCSLLLQVVKVVFLVNKDGDVLVITAYPTNVSIK
ncbi:unnamed protein product, partial [Porites lobata]